MNAKLADRLTQEVVDDWMHRLAVIRQRMLERGDAQHAEKLWQLIAKVKAREFTIGFCGHFSAGKSSMINELWNEDLLPSSPIPASANTVKVKAGEPWARVYFKDRNPIHMDFPYDIAKIKAYCLDGEEAASVEISHPSEYFPKRVAILDTPGIDSTDDAHRAATASQLHLADVVFYVMDYNHVQSEVNFHFAKGIQEQGKPLYFVINQIDKHNESELPFDAFQQSVEMALEHWNVEPDGIFYTSLVQQSEYNELPKLKQLIKSLIAQKDRHLISSIQKAAALMIEEHLKWLKAQHAEEMASSDSAMKHLSAEERQRAKQEYESALRRKTEIEGMVETFEKGLKEEIESILNNAILMPFETRELAKQYLEAMEEKFKVGFLFSRNKTEEERTRRTNAFYANFLEKVTAQLDWHVKHGLVDLAKRHGINNDALFSAIYNETIDIPVSILSEQRKTGALVSGDYLLKYTEDVAHAAKNIYRSFSDEMIEKLAHELEQNIHRERIALEEKINRNRKIMDALQKQAQYQQEERKAYSQLQALLSEEAHLSLDEVAFAMANLPAEPTVEIVDDKEHRLPQRNKVNSEFRANQPLNADKTSGREDVEAIVHKLKAIAQEIKDVKGMQTAAEELIERAARLENKQFTVALFGAFSAGKSSFANALIGSSVLPVSPNPTTAAINKIVPVDDEHPHGTAIVKMKSEKGLIYEINQSLKFFDEKIDSLHGLEKKIAGLSGAPIPSQAKTHYAFLHAIQRGIEFFREQAGKELAISLEEFQAFAAQEEKAAFVEWIELYFDCPLTRQGITLVDTPGADSINARHTGVAFDYIKNADAILFVTYYNHAFSRADQDFLTQLGSVKDVFELDKMFFIVNAADLAKSEEELALVVDYVKEQLLQHQIRHPRIFPVSSQAALLARLGQQEKLAKEQLDRLKALLSQPDAKKGEWLQKGLSMSNIETFENTFYQFINIDLSAAAVAAAKTEITRTIETLKDWIASAKQGEAERLRQKEQTKKIRDEVKQFIQSFQSTTEKQRLMQEVEELFYYVKQRLFLRFNDRFRQSFNPAVLQPGEHTMREKLKAGANELAESIGYDLVQEMRATSLRIETFMRKQMTHLFKEMETAIHQLASAEFLHEFQLSEIGSPSIQETFYTLNAKDLYPLLSIFKNPKQFFEQNGQHELCEAMEQAFQKPVDEYLQAALEQFKQHYQKTFSNGVGALRKQVEKEVENYIEGKLAALSAARDLPHLEGVYHKIKNLA